MSDRNLWPPVCQLRSPVLPFVLLVVSGSREQHKLEPMWIKLKSLMAKISQIGRKSKILLKMEIQEQMRGEKGVGLVLDQNV